MMPYPALIALLAAALITTLTAVSLCSTNPERRNHAYRLIKLLLGR
jgi:hypothetical protein